MSDFENLPPFKGTITPYSQQSVVPSYIALGGTSFTALTSNTWPSGSLAILIPFYLDSPMVVVSMFWINGAAVSGNVEAGVYNSDGRKLFSTGAQGQSGTSAIQKTVLKTAQQLPPGLYYLALVADNTTATLQGQVNRLATGTLVQVLGMAQATTSFPLPAAPTLKMIGQENIPVVGISSDAEV